MTATLIIPARFNGPRDSANGGVTAGRLAALLDPSDPVEVTLRRPPPLDTPMRVEFGEGTAQVFAGDELIATARVVATVGEAVEPVVFPDAVVAALGYDGLNAHPFPTCFVCGTERPLRDGLEVFAGPVPGDRHRTAAALVLRPEHVDAGRGPDAGRARLGEIHPHLDAGLMWAALDCPGGWAIGLPARPAVLGRMTARITAVPAIGEHCVVVGRLDEWQGRKAFTRTTAYGADGRELGRAASIWIELPH